MYSLGVMTEKTKKEKSLNRCLHCLENLAVDSRLRIYKFLADNGESRVSEVVSFIRLSQPTVSYHLKEMKKSGLLTSVKKGKEVFYSVKKECASLHAACGIQEFISKI